MAQIIIPSRWCEQPQHSVEVAWNHPSNRDLFGWWTFNGGAWRDISGLHPKASVLYGTAGHFVSSPQLKGVAFSGNGSNRYIASPIGSGLAVGAGPFTVEIAYLTTTNKAYNEYVYADTSGTSNADIDVYSEATGDISIHSTSYNCDVNNPINKPAHFLFTRTGTGTNTAQSYFNGKFVQSRSPSEIQDYSPSTIYFGCFGAGSSDFLAGQLLYVRILRRHVLAGEAAERYADWWGPIKSVSRRIYVELPAAQQGATATTNVAGVIALRSSSTAQTVVLRTTDVAGRASVKASITQEAVHVITVAGRAAVRSSATQAPIHNAAVAGYARLAGTAATQKLGLADNAGKIVLRSTSAATATGANQTDVAGRLRFVSSAAATRILWQYAQPDATVAAGTWAPTGAASLQAAVNEGTPSDTEYIHSESSDDLFVLTLGDIPTPPVRTDHALLIRVPSGFTPNGALTMRLYENYPTTVVKEWTITTPAADTDYELALSEGEASAIGNYSDLAVSGRTAA